MMKKVPFSLVICQKEWVILSCKTSLLRIEPPLLATNHIKLFILMKKADLLDRKILKVISVDARRSFKEIAAQCGVSRAAIHQRVVRMVQRGIIVGSGYQVNPKFLGFGTCTYIGIKLERGSLYKTAVARLTEIPEIVECHFTTGPYTMLAKLYSRDNEHLRDLLNNKIQEIPGVTSTETMISLEQSIQRTIPISTECDIEDNEKEIYASVTDFVDEVDE